MPKGLNINCFHFKITTFDDKKNIVDTHYYRTANEICNKYGCTRRVIYLQMQDNNRQSKYFKNVLIERIHIPLKIEIINPKFNDCNYINNTTKNTPENNTICNE